MRNTKVQSTQLKFRFPVVVSHFSKDRTWNELHIDFALKKTASRQCVSSMDPIFTTKKLSHFNVLMSREKFTEKGL